jgi:hypothetical protein
MTRREPLRLLVVDSLISLEGTPLPVPATPDRLALRDRLREWELDYARARRPATVRAVRADWQQYIAWCEGASAYPLPAAMPQLLRFVEDMRVRGKRKSTLERYVFSIRAVHQGARLPDPTHDPDWALKWSGLVADLVAADKALQRQAAPLQTPQCAQILAALGDRPIDVRDAALLSFASDTLCRESEVAGARLEFLRPKADGTGWTYLLGQST